MAVAVVPLRVFLMDDHEVVREGVRQLLESSGEIQVVGEVKGIFGSQKLDLEWHLLGGATLHAPPP